MRRRRLSHGRGWALGLAACLVMTACGPGVRAVDDQVGVVPDGPQPAETVRFAPAAIPVMGQANAGDFDLGLLFDQQVFGRADRPGGRHQ